LPETKQRLQTAEQAFASPGAAQKIVIGRKEHICTTLIGWREVQGANLFSRVSSPQKSARRLSLQ
jgi:hypothetical protein